MEIKSKFAHDAELMSKSNDSIASVTGNILSSVLNAPSMEHFDFSRLIGSRQAFIYQEFHADGPYRRSKIVVGGRLQPQIYRGIGGFEILPYPDNKYTVRYHITTDRTPKIKSQKILTSLLQELYSDIYIGSVNGGSIPATYLIDNKHLHIQIKAGTEKTQSSLYAEIPTNSQSILFAPITETKPGIPEGIMNVVAQMLEHGNLIINYGIKDNTMVSEVLYGGVDYS